MKLQVQQKFVVFVFFLQYGIQSNLRILLLACKLQEIQVQHSDIQMRQGLLETNQIELTHCHPQNKIQNINNQVLIFQTNNINIRKHIFTIQVHFELIVHIFIFQVYKNVIKSYLRLHSNIVSVGKIQTPIFLFFLKKVVNIAIELGPVSSECPIL